MFDVGKITRDIQGQFGLFATTPDPTEENRATPEYLAVLVGSLGDLTRAMEVRRAELSDWLPDKGVIDWDRDFAKWKNRLVMYAAEVSAAAPGDRKAVLWTVTAPLLLGFFGGAEGKLPKQPIDAATPFSLSNQLDVSQSWRAQQWDLLYEDLKKNAVDAVSSGVGGLLIAAAVVVVGYFGFKWLSNR